MPGPGPHGRPGGWGRRGWRLLVSTAVADPDETTSHPDRTVSPPEEAVTFPGARRPDRHRRVTASGIELHVCEWGDAAAPPLLLAHGGFDFTGTFDVFAPMLADAGWRVVSWDQRFFDDSATTEIYSISLHDALPRGSQRYGFRLFFLGKLCALRVI